MTKGSRQLQLSRRDLFFQDPIFQDILAHDDLGLQKKLDLFKSNDLALAGRQPEAAHNLQVTVSNDKFMVQLELPGFFPEDFALKTKDDVILLEAKHEAKADKDTEYTARNYSKEFAMPEGVLADQLTSSYSSDGILTIEAPRILTAPEGATVQEAMAAKSKAFTTDDGRTNVKEDSQASSQVIAAQTESPDGRTKSSMTFSSNSSSSSSTVTSSSGPGGMPMSMPSLMGGGFGNNRPMQMDMRPMTMDMGMNRGGDMDNMMQKMMGDMSLGMSGPGMSMDMGMGNMGNMMSGTSSSNFSTSSSSTMQSSSSSMMDRQDMMGGMMGPPPPLRMAGMAMGGQRGLDIEELSTCGSDFSGPVNYTVTSPPPPPPAATPTGPSAPPTGPSSELKHSVRPTADFRPQRDPQADHTVLLKLKEGNEYKLVLNMQQYQPEDITVKLNDDRELTVAAHAGELTGKGQAGQSSSTEDFVQRHLVPEGIDLDQLTSSFSADGILVIKAPRVKK